MLNYAFRLMSAHFAIVTKLEAEFEHFRSDKSKKRDRRITDWAQEEVEYSKLFNEAHKESVFSDFKALNQKDVSNLASQLTKNRGTLFKNHKEEKELANNEDQSKNEKAHNKVFSINASSPNVDEDEVDELTEKLNKVSEQA